jgi:hypothetical protein
MQLTPPSSVGHFDNCGVNESDRSISSISLKNWFQKINQTFQEFSELSSYPKAALLPKQVLGKNLGLAISSGKALSRSMKYFFIVKYLQLDSFKLSAS